MPRTNKKFDWEVYDENHEFLDIITMTRDEAKKYRSAFPNHVLKEIGYSDG